MGLQVPCIDPLSETHGSPCPFQPTSDREVEIDMSHVKPSDPQSAQPPVRTVPELPVRQVRETVEIIGFETHVPTRAELEIATTTAAVTATTAVIASTMVQQLIKLLQPVFKAGLKKVFRRNDKKRDTE